MDHAQTLDRAVTATGGEAEFLSRLGISRRTLFYWKSGGIPPFRLAAVARASGIPASELRPDLFVAEGAK